MSISHLIRPSAAQAYMLEDTNLQISVCQHAQCFYDFHINHARSTIVSSPAIQTPEPDIQPISQHATTLHLRRHWPTRP